MPPAATFPPVTDQESTASRPLTAWLVRLSGAWILAGALFKLLEGTPGDLPQVVRDFPLELGLTYKLAISIELALAGLAFLRPRWAWLPLIGCFLLFDAILVSLIASGAENCGCFGGSISMPPWLMLSIDTVLLVGVLATSPWRNLPPRGLPIPFVALVCAVGIGLPWFFDREVPTDPTVVVAGEELEDTNSYVIFDLASWEGQDIGETPLAKFMNVYEMPPDGVWVLYRADCEHCADHLAQMADHEQGERFVTLIRLMQDHDSDGNRLIHRMPAGDFVQNVELPATVKYVMQTPGELELEGFNVVRGEEGVEVH